MLTFPVALSHEHDVDFLMAIYTHRSLFNIIMVVMVLGVPTRLDKNQSVEKCAFGLRISKDFAIYVATTIALILCVCICKKHVFSGHASSEQDVLFDERAGYCLV